MPHIQVLDQITIDKNWLKMRLMRKPPLLQSKLKTEEFHLSVLQIMDAGLKQMK